MGETCFLTTHDPCVVGVVVADGEGVTAAGQVERAHAAFEAGAALVHLRAGGGRAPASDPAAVTALLEGVRKRCPGIVVQLSTDALGRALDRRRAVLQLRPDMAALATGSCNAGDRVHENPPELVRSLAAAMRGLGVKPGVEVLDLAMLYNAAGLVDAGLIPSPPHVEFVLGVENALPARREVLQFEVRALATLMPGATWAAAGVGEHGRRVTYWTLELGGHCRVELGAGPGGGGAASPEGCARLVSEVAAACVGFGRAVATPGQARRMLGLSPVGALA